MTWRQRFILKASAWVAHTRRFAATVWARYRALPTWPRRTVAAGVLVILFGLAYTIGGSGGGEAQMNTLPTVTVASIGQLTGGGGSVNTIGSVRSVAEAAILAQSSGTVTGMYAKIGQTVAPGAVLVQLENASQRATLLQAEGAYEAALVASEGKSAADVAASARSAYVAAYATLDTTLKNEVDDFFGSPTAYGPALLIDAPMYSYGELSRDRAELTTKMEAYQHALADALTSGPLTLLESAIGTTQDIITFLDKLAVAAHDRDSQATEDQLTALGTARTSVSTVRTTLSSARDSYRSDIVGATGAAAASVKSALGSLRAAQAALEKTLVRAPIGGTVNFLPIRIGDYVSALTHIATVARNTTLEILAYISSEDRVLLSVGTEVIVESLYRATVASIAPALDPRTKQIEIRLALIGSTPLTNGQSVRIALPGRAPATTASTNLLLLPLTSVKLTPTTRIIFSVGEDDRLIAHPVVIGDVRGENIEVTTPLSFDLEIVTDARGLSEGQKVSVSRAP